MAPLTQIASRGQQYALRPRSKPEAMAPRSASACSAAASAERLQVNGVGRLGEVEIGNRLDEIVPLLGGGVLDQVEVGRTKPVERRAGASARTSLDRRSSP